MNSSVTGPVGGTGAGPESEKQDTANTNSRLAGNSPPAMIFDKPRRRESAGNRGIGFMIGTGGKVVGRGPARRWKLFPQSPRRSIRSIQQ
ncbi:MAG: hypothetical protein V3S64_07715 [bacterium]